MNPADHHVATSTAVKAKKERDERAALHGGHRHPSQASRIGAIIVWLLALGTMVALFMLR